MSWPDKSVISTGMYTMRSGDDGPPAQASVSMRASPLLSLYGLFRPLRRSAIIYMKGGRVITS